jgi:hypothetical protein
MAEDVRLVDLEVIQRFSIAVRGESAPRAEVIEALRADLEWLGAAAPAPASATPAAPRRRAPVKAPVKAPARKTAVKPVARGGRTAAKAATKRTRG